MNPDPSAHQPWHWRCGAWKLATGGLLTWLVFHFGVPVRVDECWRATIGTDSFIGHRGQVLAFAVLSLPVVMAAIGLLELSLRRPFRRITASWDTLPEWAQGLLVLVLTVGSFALLIGYANRLLALP
jgi:hypothetical protein